MKKTIFTNTTFKIIILLILLILAIFNLYNFYLSKNYINLLPFLIQITIIILIFTEHKYAKLGISIWSILMIMLLQPL